MIARDLVVEELARIATRAGNTPATREIERLRDNARRLINKCIPSLVTLLESNGSVREFADTLVGFLAPPAPTDLNEIIRIETRLQGELDPVQVEVAIGDRSLPTLAAMERKADEALPVYKAMKEEARRLRLQTILSQGEVFAA
jgi:hypothetical protein